MSEPPLQPGDKRVRGYLGTVDIPEGSAVGLYLVAVQYRQAVHDLAAADSGARLTEPMFRPIFHNAEQCIELLLKAFILGNNPSLASQTKKFDFRHNLKALLDLAMSFGLKLDQSLQDEISNEAAFTSSNHFFRYGMSTNKSASNDVDVIIPNPLLMISAIEVLMPQVAKAVGRTWP